MIRFKDCRYIKSKDTFTNRRGGDEGCVCFVYFERKTYEIKGKAKDLWEKVVSSELYELYEDEVEENVLMLNLISRGWVSMVIDELCMTKAQYVILEKVNDKYLMFSTMFGNLEYCSKEVYDALTTNIVDSLEQKLITYLYRKNYVQYRNQEQFESLIIQDMYYSVYFIFSYVCNMACVYCFEGEKKNERMSEETFLDACEYVEELSKKAKVDVAFYGGEPLIAANRELIRRTMFKFSKNENVFFRFITNGVNVMDYMNLFLMYKHKIREFAITIDGPETIHDKKRKMCDGSGTYRKVMESITMLTKNEFGVTIRINLDADTIQAQCESVALINRAITNKEKASINIHQVHYRYNEKHENVDLLECFQLFVQLEKESEIPVIIAHPFYNVYKRTLNKDNSFPYIWQGFCRTKMTRVIDVDGKIYSCTEAMIEDGLSIGDVSDTQLKYPGDKMKCARSECVKCDYYLLCYGKCSLQNYIDDNIMTPTCEKNELRKIVKDFAHYL